MSNPSKTVTSIPVELRRKHAKEPFKSTTGAACFDIAFCPMEGQGDVILRRNTVSKVPTGLSFKVPAGWELTIRPRSGLGARGIQVHPGTIDSDYRGEVFVLMTCVVDVYVIRPGDNIAQISLRKLPQVEFKRVDKVLIDTERGEGGFGHTGR